MTLAPASRFGSYEVLSAIGAGGMGEVYRARDTKLNRDVALKILPESFALDPERLARFRREAQVLASLNHPNIAAIYGVEESNGTQALVLELVDGPTLADRIAQGPITLDKALPISKQVADALEAAHEQGIVHRDLKPANVKVRPDGTVKVLDFGLAKAMEPAATGAPGLVDSPTLTSPAMMTGVGVLLGTAPYMSPEQAKGRPADRRSDIWAFGCVLYEMLTGERPFKGDDVANTLAAVLRAEPDWNVLPASTPPSVHRLLRRSLAKDPKARIGDAAVLRMDIDEARDPPAIQSRSPASGRVWTAVGLVSFIAAVGIGAIAFFLSSNASVRTAPERHVDIVTPETRETASIASIALSSDGRYLAYVADRNGRDRLWIRDLETGAVKAFENTAGAHFPFWAPDGRSLGLILNMRLVTVDVASRSIRDLAPAPLGLGAGAWGPDGTIIYSPSGARPLMRVSATGGDPSPVTQLTPGQGGHRAPSFLPDGRHFVFFAAGAAPEARGVYLGSTDGAPIRKLIDADAGGPYVNGYVLLVRGGALFAQSLDPSTWQVSGDVVKIAERISSLVGGVVALSASSSGTIALRAGILGDVRQLMWFDRNGQRVGALGQSEPSTNMGVGGIALSPDGTRVATTRILNGNADIFVLEVGRGLWTKMTTNPLVDTGPVWSPDGRRLAFTSSDASLVVKDAVANAREDRLVESDAFKSWIDWSQDGRFLVFDTVVADGTRDLWSFDLETHTASPIVKTPADEANGQVSPDRKWIAFESNQSGQQTEVYVQPFQTPGAPIQISTTGGAQPRWSADGAELFYIALDERLEAVRMTRSPDGRTITPAAPTPLFSVRVPFGVVQLGGTHRQYAISRDGRFLVNTILPDPNEPPITLILNWHPPSP